MSISFGESTPEMRMRAKDAVSLFYSEPRPAWFDCPAKEFIEVWLPRFERGELPKPTQAELAKLNKGYTEEAYIPPPPRTKSIVIGRPPKVGNSDIIQWLQQNQASSTRLAAHHLGIHWKTLERRLFELEAAGSVERSKRGNKLIPLGKEKIFWQAKGMQ